MGFKKEINILVWNLKRKKVKEEISFSDFCNRFFEGDEKSKNLFADSIDRHKEYEIQTVDRSLWKFYKKSNKKTGDKNTSYLGDVPGFMRDLPNTNPIMSQGLLRENKEIGYAAGLFGFSIIYLGERPFYLLKWYDVSSGSSRLLETINPLLLDNPRDFMTHFEKGLGKYVKK